MFLSRFRRGFERKGAWQWPWKHAGEAICVFSQTSEEFNCMAVCFFFLLPFKSLGSLCPPEPCMFYQSSVGYDATCTVQRALSAGSFRVGALIFHLKQIDCCKYWWRCSIFRLVCFLTEGWLCIHTAPAPLRGKLHTQPASVRRDSVATTQKNEKKWGGGGRKASIIHHFSLHQCHRGGRVRTQRRRFGDAKTAETERGVFWWFVIVFSRGRQKCETQQFGSWKKDLPWPPNTVSDLFFTRVFCFCFALESFRFHAIKEAKHKLQTQPGEELNGEKGNKG